MLYVRQQKFSQTHLNVERAEYKVIALPFIKEASFATRSVALAERDYEQSHEHSAITTILHQNVTVDSHFSNED